MKRGGWFWKLISRFCKTCVRWPEAKHEESMKEVFMIPGFRRSALDFFPRICDVNVPAWSTEWNLWDCSGRQHSQSSLHVIKSKRCLICRTSRLPADSTVLLLRCLLFQSLCHPESSSSSGGVSGTVSHHQSGCVWQETSHTHTIPKRTCRHSHVVEANCNSCLHYYATSTHLFPHNYTNYIWPVITKLHTFQCNISYNCCDTIELLG